MNLDAKSVISDAEKKNRFVTQVRGCGLSLLIWVDSVRLPLVAFMLGASITSSAWLLLWGLIVLLIVTMTSLPLLTILLGVVTYFTSEHAAFSCFLVALGLVMRTESLSNYLHTKKQVEMLKNDLLSPQSNYSFEEIEVPSTVLQGFSSYLVKERVKKLAQPFVRWSGVPDGKIYDSEPMRFFRFRPSDFSKCTGAAVAYPIFRYSSLVFVRQSFEVLNDAQRQQVYHELAHGTPEGTMICLRPLRWQADAIIATLMSWALLSGCAIRVVVQPKSINVWLALGALLLATWLRSKAVAHVQRLSTAASEVLADSIALTHPEFLEGNKWMKRAKNLAKRLEGEEQYLGLKHARNFDVWFRAMWLRRWLQMGEIKAYMVGDVDPRILMAFLLYIVSGYTASIPSGWISIAFWPLLMVVLLCNMQVGLIGRRNHELLVELDDALRKNLS